MAKKGFKSVSLNENCNSLVEALIETLSQKQPGSSWSKSAVIEHCVKEYRKKLGGEQAD